MEPFVLEFREIDRARFEEIKNGTKTIETRAATKKYHAIRVGDEIQFVCGSDAFSKKVTKKYHWPTIEAMMAQVFIKKIMPDLNTTQQAKDRYASFPNYLEKIEKCGILGFELG